MAQVRSVDVEGIRQFPALVSIRTDPVWVYRHDGGEREVHDPLRDQRRTTYRRRDSTAVEMTTSLLTQCSSEITSGRRGKVLFRFFPRGSEGRPRDRK